MFQHLLTVASAHKDAAPALLCSMGPKSDVLGAGVGVSVSTWD